MGSIRHISRQVLGRYFSQAGAPRVAFLDRSTSLGNPKFLTTHRNYLVCRARTVYDYDKLWRNPSAETTNTLPVFQSNYFPISSINGQRSFSLRPGKNEGKGEKGVDKDGEVVEAQSIFQRFKVAYKENGKVLVGVHLFTSSIWYGSFLYASYSGFDGIPLLEYFGASENFIEKLTSAKWRHFAIAYALYKLFTPARYFVTIAGTQVTVRKLREWGYMAPRADEDTLRSMMKDGRVQLKEKIADKKEDMKGKVEDFKGDLKEKVDDLKDDFKDKVVDMKGDLKGKVKDVRGDLKQKIESGEWKEKVEDLKGDVQDRIRKMELKEKVTDFRDEFQQKLRETDFKDTAKEMKENLKERFDDAKEKLEEFKDDKHKKRR